MIKHLESIGNYLEFKILAGLFAAVYSDELVILLFLFIFLEMLDIFSAWCYASKKCWDSLYPQSKSSFWKLIKFIPTARRWRFIKSVRLRDGFADKMLVYLILLLLSALVDGALLIAHTPFKGIFISTVTTVLCLTESISILENLNDAGVPLVNNIKEKILKKFEKQ